MIHNPYGICSCLSATDYKQPKQIQIGTWRTHRDGRGFREVSEPICPTIPSHAREVGSGQPVIISRSHGFNKGGEKELPCLRSSSYEHNEFVKSNQSIRRLITIECERLQGFKDDHTKYGIFDGEVKEISDTQRYKMCGNAVSVPVVKAIGEKLINN